VWSGGGGGGGLGFFFFFFSAGEEKNWAMAFWAAVLTYHFSAKFCIFLLRYSFF